MDEPRDPGLDAPSRESFWQLPLGDLLRQLDTSAAGLSASEARARLDRYGSNRIAPKRALSLTRTIAGRLANPLVLVLVFAACVSAFTGDRASFFIIISSSLQSWRLVNQG